MLKDLSKSEQIITDEATDTVTYIGYAQAEVKKSEPSWIIKRISYTYNAQSIRGLIVTEWATGYMNETNIWDDRTSLSYTNHV